MVRERPRLRVINLTCPESVKYPLREEPSVGPGGKFLLSNSLVPVGSGSVTKTICCRRRGAQSLVPTEWEDSKGPSLQCGPSKGVALHIYTSMGAMCEKEAVTILGFVSSCYK